MHRIHEWAFFQGLLAQAEERVLEWEIHGVQPVPRYLRDEVCWLREEVARLAPVALRLLTESGAANEARVRQAASTGG